MLYKDRIRHAEISCRPMAELDVIYFRARHAVALLAAATRVALERYYRAWAFRNSRCQHVWRRYKIARCALAQAAEFRSKNGELYSRMNTAFYSRLLPATNITAP